MKASVRNKVCEWIESQLKALRHKRWQNKYEIKKLAQQQKDLKKEWSEMNQLYWEIKKK